MNRWSPVFNPLLSKLSILTISVLLVALILLQYRDILVFSGWKDPGRNSALGLGTAQQNMSAALLVAGQVEAKNGDAKGVKS